MRKRQNAGNDSATEESHSRPCPTSKRVTDQQSLADSPLLSFLQFPKQMSHLAARRPLFPVVLDIYLDSYNLANPPKQKYHTIRNYCFAWQTECSVNGTLNIFPGWQEGLTQLLTLTFEDNTLIDCKGGGKIGEHLQQMISREDVRITQLGIGTNPKAKDPFCATVADKFSGIVHVGLFPDTRLDHYYFPLSRMKINEKEYHRNELFE